MEARIVEHGVDYPAPPLGIVVVRCAWHGRGRLIIPEVGDAVCSALLELVVGVCRIQEYGYGTEDFLPLTSVCAIPRLTKYQAAQRPEPGVVS